MLRYDNFWARIGDVIPYAALSFFVVAVAATLFDVYYRGQKERVGVVVRTYLIGAILFFFLFILGLPLPEIGEWWDLRLIAWILGSQVISHVMLVVLVRFNIAKDEARKMRNTFLIFMLIPLCVLVTYLLTR